MKTLIGFGNLLLLAMNLSALGTITYKGKLWQPEASRQSSMASIEESLELS